MASYNELIALINAFIKQNGIQAITGQILNGVLRAMVDQIGRGYAIMGTAVPTDDPGTPDAPESWFASTPGTYTNFGGFEVADAEFALLSYTPSTGWAKTTLTEGITEVTAGVDNNVGTPYVEAEYQNGGLSFQFYNLKGATGDPAGFGTVIATVDANVGTPSVSVSGSGPDTAKNYTFAFHNLKGETGVTSVVATVDNTTGNPACAVSLVGQELHLDFTGLKGAQGNTGSSVDYPFTIVNNLTTDDATQALSAAMGVELASQVSQLEAEVDENEDLFQNEIGGSKLVEISFTENGCVVTNGSTVPTSGGVITITSSNSYRYTILSNISAGDKFVINAIGGYSARLWAFADSSFNILSVSASEITVSHLNLTAPENAYYLIINDKKSGGRCYSGQSFLDYVTGYVASSVSGYVSASEETGDRFGITKLSIGGTDYDVLDDNERRFLDGINFADLPINKGWFGYSSFVSNGTHKVCYAKNIGSITITANATRGSFVIFGNDYHIGAASSTYVRTQLSAGETKTISVNQNYKFIAIGLLGSDNADYSPSSCSFKGMKESLADLESATNENIADLASILYVRRGYDLVTHAGGGANIALSSVRLVNGHYYRGVLIPESSFTPTANFTFKVMSSDSESELLLIKQLNGVAVSGGVRNVFEFQNTLPTGNDYRIGFYNQYRNCGKCTVLIEEYYVSSESDDYHNDDLVKAIRKNFIAPASTSAQMAANGLNTQQTIVHITDIHADWPRAERIFNYATKLSGSTLVCSGDIVQLSSSGSIASYLALMANYSGKYVHCVGNHDVWGYGQESAYNKYIAPWMNTYNMPWTLPNATTYPNPTFFHWDDTDWNVRYIVLDQWRSSSNTDESHYSFTYTQEQINWLQSILASVPENYGVIVLMHSIEGTPAMDNAYTKFWSKTGERTAHININPVARLIDAFISKTSISATISSASETLVLNADFSGVASNEFIAYICGHSHTDDVTYASGTVNKQLVLCETCSTAIYSTSTSNALTECSDLAREQTGQNQDAFNVYVIDRGRKKVRIVRVGADMPFDLSERRDCMVIPYAES